MKSWVRSVASVVALAALCTPALADGGHGMHIRVLDADAQVVPDAAVMVRDGTGAVGKAIDLADGTHYAVCDGQKVSLEIECPGLPAAQAEFALPRDQAVLTVDVVIDSKTGKASFELLPLAPATTASAWLLPGPAPSGGGGAGGASTITVCDGSETPEGEPVCADDYVDDFNGGLNSTPAVYSPIACGESVCGETGNFLFGGLQNRDTDWYLVSLVAQTDVTWSVTADGFAHAITTVDISVPGGAVVGDFAVSVAGETISVTNCLAPGDWALFVSTAAFTGVPCGSQYQGTVSCVPCLPPPAGACCLLDGSCLDLTEADCISAGGNWQGGGTACPFVCPAGPCGPGNGDCYASNGTPGCEDPACCATVCALDPFCCDTAWDTICANEAITFCGTIPTEPNDECAGAIDIGPLPTNVVGSTIGQGADTAPFCGTSDGTGGGLWYTLAGTGNTITLTTCESQPGGGSATYDTKIRVYCMDCDNLACVAGNDDEAGCNFHSTVNFCSQIGAEYLVLVHGFSSGEGQFNMAAFDDGVPCIGAGCIPSGACCQMNGSCADNVIQADCEAAGGLYQGDATQCAGGFVGYAVSACVDGFEDISTTGILAPMASSSDDAGDVVPIGFAFPFYLGGASHTMVGIASNGYLTFGNTLGDFTNDPCPSSAAPNDLIAPCWDDWSPNLAGDVYYETTGTAGVDLRFIAQWNGVDHYPGGATPSTFQAILYEDGSIRFNYGALDPGRTATVGLENFDGTDGVCLPDTTDSCTLIAPTFTDPVVCVGACCFDDGSCVDYELASDCTGAGGVFQGFGGTCATVTCPVGATGACCTGAACQVVSLGECITMGGVYQGDGLACLPALCVGLTGGVGACCLPGTLAPPTCMVTDEASCMAALGVYQGDGVGCAAGLCPANLGATGACCFPDGSCEIRSQWSCENDGGIYQGNGQGCFGSLCPQPGACCLPDGTCVQETEVAPGGEDICDEKDGGVYQGDDTFCGLTECPQACCLPNGSCALMLEADCIGAGGVPQGVPQECMAGLCPQPDRAGSTDKGSLVIFAAVELRWSGIGPAGPNMLVQDTFLSLTNDYPQDVRVQLYFVNGDPPLPADPATGERAHPGWNWVDNAFILTDDHPVYWSVATGLPAVGGVAPFTVLDPGSPPGRPAPDGSGDRVLRGFVLAWAINSDYEEISWNHLAGMGTIVNYAKGFAWEYGATMYNVVAPVSRGAQPGSPGILKLDAFEYAQSYDELLLDFQAAGSSSFSGPRLIMSDTQLTLMPVPLDLRQETDGPLTTLATFEMWNMNEVKFSETSRCITCWDQTLISDYGIPNSFVIQALQTDFGKARINAVASTDCEVDVDPLDGPCGSNPGDVCSEPAPLIGVAARLLNVDGGMDYAAAGTNLIGLGVDRTATIKYDVPSGPPEATFPQTPEEVLEWLEDQLGIDLGTGRGTSGPGH